MKPFTRALCTILALSIALPWNVFASSAPIEMNDVQVATYDDPADFLAKLPDEIKVIETVSRSSEEYAAPPASEIQALKPLGRAIENRKTNATLQFVCLQNVANVPDCVRFQLRKDGVKLVGPQYVIKAMKKEILASHLHKKISSDRDRKKWDYMDYDDAPFTTKDLESIGDLNHDIYGGTNGLLLPLILGGVVAGVYVGSNILAATGVCWLVGFGVFLGVVALPFVLTLAVPFVVATAVIVVVDLAVMNRNLIADIGGAIRAHRANKAYRAMMDEKQSDRKPYRTSNKNFEYLLKNFAI
ncbi:MAG: hypothetical protein HYW49_02260 [Deltaproteobacteria bacterium]|nr:hypothetical protein [Deltaproteobacteria bacterium]